MNDVVIRTVRSLDVLLLSIRPAALPQAAAGAHEREIPAQALRWDFSVWARRASGLASVLRDVPVELVGAQPLRSSAAPARTATTPSAGACQTAGEHGTGAMPLAGGVDAEELEVKVVAVSGAERS
ncbi:hypothetical protein [Nonomuraea diastatica]|uniref:Uncharacterized protein n=1 Tax=Nonomuraea diastatica TaxID=1848329 RepID=A0A4R4WQL5_9ACTN|nr:hypothetical protein [Nonomuraea diastatica]TDD19115.1 hypothetical protein E1294_22175 [Nonomuraea diastatica]